ncbi:hypothetical protein [Halopiger thermotolerans]
MIGMDSAPTVVIAGFALALSAAIGLVAHESAHALVLRLARVEYTVVFFPGQNGVLGRLAGCPWAVVRPTPTGREPAWVLRFAALAPALLALPVLAAGLTTDLTAETPIASAIAIGWLACSIPSPQDFSVAFYAHRLLADARDASGATNAAASLSRAD